MSLEEKINADLKAAMMAKDQAAMDSLRAIKSAILLIKTEKGGSGEINEEREMQLLTKMIKQRQESIDIFEKQSRADLADREKAQLEVIKKYLPEQMGEEQVREIVKAAIAATGALSQKDMGKVMGAIKEKVAGKADGKLVAEVVKSLLS